MKKCLIKISKSESDNAETKFISYNLKAMSVEVGKEIWVEAPYYYEVLAKGNLAERTTLIKEQEF